MRGLFLVANAAVALHVAKSSILTGPNLRSRPAFFAHTTRGKAAASTLSDLPAAAHGFVFGEELMNYRSTRDPTE